MKVDAPVLIACNLSTGYAGNILHERLDLQLFPGSLTCLLGLNGAGKSTLMRTLCGLQPPITGQIKLLNKPLHEYSPHALAQTVGVVLTEKRYVADLTAFDIVALGRHPHTGFFGALKQNDREIIEQSLEAVGMASAAKRQLAAMSDGEKQKIMIAKAIAQQCPIILLDEPTAFLDVISRIETMILLRKLAREQQKAVLLSTHDLEQAIKTADYFWVLRRNYPPACGVPEDLILNGTLSSFFDKNGLTFDPIAGQNALNSYANPVGTVGNSPVVDWVNKALVRTGRNPLPPGPGYPCVNCIGADEFVVIFPDGFRRKLSSVAELLSVLPPTR
ncbi:MAG: ABC transporter ATP-binding protein [Tannerellaceae bacterium]|jgi:iron complex transport system ATP-binding protein|nr:ABC transporter ATP-binding protein [Tannerellaceae bacterium]